MALGLALGLATALVTIAVTMIPMVAHRHLSTTTDPHHHLLTPTCTISVAPQIVRGTTTLQTHTDQDLRRMIVRVINHTVAIATGLGTTTPASISISSLAAVPLSPRLQNTHPQEDPQDRNNQPVGEIEDVAVVVAAAEVVHTTHHPRQALALFFAQRESPPLSRWRA